MPRRARRGTGLPIHPRRRRRSDGRLTITALAERVRLSVSPCHRRLRALERSAAISGYRAPPDADALGLTFEALVFVTMRGADRDTVDAFEQAVAAIPNVQQVYDDRLATLPGVQRLTSTLVMKSVVENRPLPL